MALLIYRLLFPFAFLAAMPFYALRLFRRERGRADLAKPQGYHVGLGERFGRYNHVLTKRLSQAPPVWISSISIGETLVALKLARALRSADPGVRVVISVTTSTGYELLLRDAAGADWIIPMYNPVDFAFVARRAVRAVRPRALVLTEGGIWPNLLATARANGIRTVLAGARLSPTSEMRWRRFPRVARAVWNLFDLVCVPEPGDAARFEGIGVNSHRTRHTGSIKLDNTLADTPSREAEFRSLIEPLGFSGPLLVGGSTWAPEEMILGAASRELRGEFPGLRLILVPRHIERSEAIARELEQSGLRVVRRSNLPWITPADVLLVDTTGELRDWYRLASVAFVGKSMPGVSETGGQNAGEPAAFGIPVIFGPRMENFSPLVSHLLKCSAAVQIPDSAALAPALRTLLGDPAKRAAIGQRARESLATHQGAAARTAALLLDARD